MTLLTLWYLAHQLQSFGVLSLVGNTDGLQSADDSQVHVENKWTLLDVQRHSHTVPKSHKHTYKALLVRVK